MTFFKSALMAGVIAAIPAVSMAETTTLEIASWKGNAAEPAGLPALIETFEKANPSIKVKLTYASHNDFDTAIVPRLAGSNSPDVIMADIPLMNRLAKAGVIVPLDTAGWIGKVNPTLRAAITGKKDVYLFPLEVIGIGNFVNLDLLQKAGIAKPPQTIDELVSACKALSAAGIQPMLMAQGFPSAVFAMAQGLQANEAPAADYGSGKVSFAKSKAFNDAFATLHTLETAGCFKGREQAAVDPWSTGLQEFKAGHFAMMPQGAWNISAFSKVKGLNYVFTPLPAAKAPGVSFDLFGFGWALPKNAQHAQAAKTWIDFFKKEENLKVLLTEEAAGSPFAGQASGTPALAEAYEKGRDGGLIWYPVGVGAWSGGLETAIFNSMAGFLNDTSASPKTVLSKWDEAAED
ncbi:hypothetical protein BJF93_07285 [Xaviernesmea oryzae]|uniref:Uncharacterized protein n=1 Tax=Xaviernesmea oryzae TaxID=464029 RepID=A0A1Q9AW87_9HYPH|nr:extracellular solute-binding protein [Xaviernesmea oryzae]OLP59690.1 hypothetical protein BJF93_07285 [Xaviernesmea oryzae]SEM34994.1 raffinose/stachyose/melibiose transport system substrate-binding protein [Xaviernesmea oryzae]